MIYVLLFWTFLKVGQFTIGGGYAMIPLIQQAVLDEMNWMTAEQFAEFVGIAESTPGPFAINISTFCGLTVAETAGGSPLLGSVCATLGVITPSLMIILALAGLCRTAMKHWSVKAALNGARPVVVGLIGAAAVGLLTHTLLPEGASFQWRPALLAAGLFALAQWRNIGAIKLIALGAILGLLLQCFGLSL